MLSILALFVVFVISAPTEREVRKVFFSWQSQYQKTYVSFDELRHRFEIFRDNYEFITAHDPVATGFNVGLNRFADLTSEEFVAFFNGLNVTKIFTGVSATKVDVGVPSTWDWRTQGAVTPVKNQQQCGSCWAFSTTGSTEGAHFLKTRSLVSLSEQNLIDCSKPEGNDGCNGGFMDDAFRYIISNHGVDTESSYPYTATGPNSCKYDVANKGATLSSYHDIPTGSEIDLLNGVAKTPVSVAIDASHKSFQLYTGGVYYEPKCSSTNLDHGVLSLGWGTENGQDYWLVKNSWGADWGDEGYIKMSRNRGNNCGIATAASYPIV